MGEIDNINWIESQILSPNRAEPFLVGISFITITRITKRKGIEWDAFAIL